ncbi:hypothetical protein HYT26_00745 [Candidatus Pacearchaeota archaeon]|nr:hypothetical protein [Candidatus Pacearchaeota archaeon]
MIGRECKMWFLVWLFIIGGWIICGFAVALAVLPEFLSAYQEVLKMEGKREIAKIIGLTLLIILFPPAVFIIGISQRMRKKAN